MTTENLEEIAEKLFDKHIHRFYGEVMTLDEFKSALSEALQSIHPDSKLVEEIKKKKEEYEIIARANKGIEETLSAYTHRNYGKIIMCEHLLQFSQEGAGK